jgi:hypothetical protein
MHKKLAENNSKLTEEGNELALTEVEMLHLD